ncbi:MAG: ChaN family lipoprotein [Bdellovibrionaceae bacterium]|nr:ChaN family lipoprotein [Pseudobdellovibrionaceae bacterium]
MIEKNEWIKARKKLLTQLKSQVFAIQGRDREIDAYAKNYKYEFLGKWQPSSTRDLILELSQQKLVLGGDFHAFSQAQRTHLRILRDWPKKRQLVLALECIEAKHQKYLELFMKDEISEKEFLRLCQWSDHWGFSWSHYKPLFEFAKTQGIPVFAVNRYYKKRSLTSLVNRDLFAAKKITKLIQKFPEATIYTIFGDLHLASNHLPNYIKEVIGKPQFKMAQVFLNSERLYFQLAKKNLEMEVEVLRSKNSRFCIMSSPPWVKWQSYLMFLEGAYDDDLEEDYDKIDFTDHVAQLVEVMKKDIKMNISLDDLAVYNSEDFSVWRKVAEKLKPKERKYFLKLIEDEKTFILPKQNFYYLSRLSINHCAHLAGFYFHKKVSGLNKSLWDMPNDFLPLIWHEAVAFYLSKLINHKRKAEKLSVVENQLRHTEEIDQGREALALVLDQKTDEWIYVKSGRHKKERLKAKKTISYLHAARILGSMMGEKLYDAYIMGRIKKTTLITFLQKDLCSSDFNDFYYLMTQRLEAHLALKQKGVRL